MTNATTEPLAPSPWQEYLRSARALVADGPDLEARGTLTRITPDGKKEIVAEPGGGPNGAAIGPDGACYICNNGGFEWHERDGMLIPGDIAKNYSGGRIERVDLKTGKVETLYNIPGSVPNPINMPNYCYFRDSCEMRGECGGLCDGKYPPSIRISDTHVVSCYRFFDKGEILEYPKPVNVEEL